MKKFKALIATLAIIAASLFAVTAVAAPAQAGPSCDVGLWCGKMDHLYWGQAVSIPISCRFTTGGPVAGYTHYLPMGTSSTSYCHDMDGFAVPYGYDVVWGNPYTGCNGREGATGWHKTNDLWQKNTWVVRDGAPC